MRRRRIGLVTTLAAVALAAAVVRGAAPVEGRVRSSDGVEIVYSFGGAGDVALLFVHGGLADRAFWAPQMSALASKYRVVALDLAGHGASGRNRKAWTIGAWAEDVKAVADKLGLRRTVLVGNSLGGPVALEPAALLPGRVLGVVGVDTLQDVTVERNPAASRERAEAFRSDFAGTCKALVASLFHPGTQAELRAWAERRMCASSPEMVASMMEGFAEYDPAAAFRKAGVPIRAINGDLFPTRIEKNRTVAADFDAVVIKGAGHYPMLERPGEFNRNVIAIVQALPGVGRSGN